MSSESRIELLRKILKVPTINENEGRIADIIEAALKDLPNLTFTRVQYAPGRDNLIVDINQPENQSKVLGFNGHLDVVDTGNTDLWTYAPFAAVMTDDRIYGRGAADMKAGVAAMVCAVKELLEAGATFNGGIRLLFTVGEEIDNFGARQLSALGYSQPLTALVVGEPTGQAIWHAHKGIIDFTAQATGKSAHGAMPELGINAIDHLFDFYAQAKQTMAPLLAKVDPDLGQTTFNVTLISGGNQINSIPQFAKLRGNIRTVTAVPNETIIAALKAATAEINTLPEHKIELTIDSTINAISSPANSEIATCVQNAAKTHAWPVKLTVGAPTTDAALFETDQHQFPFIVIGPGNTSAHQVDEYVTIQDYLKVTDIYKSVITQYLA